MRQDEMCSCCGVFHGGALKCGKVAFFGTTTNGTYIHNTTPHHTTPHHNTPQHKAHHNTNFDGPRNDVSCVLERKRWRNVVTSEIPKRARALRRRARHLSKGTRAQEHNGTRARERKGMLSASNSNHVPLQAQAQRVNVETLKGSQ